MVSIRVLGLLGWVTGVPIQVPVRPLGATRVPGRDLDSVGDPSDATSTVGTPSPRSLTGAVKRVVPLSYIDGHFLRVVSFRPADSPFLFPSRHPRNSWNTRTQVVTVPDTQSQCLRLLKENYFTHSQLKAGDSHRSTYFQAFLSVQDWGTSTLTIESQSL